MRHKIRHAVFQQELPVALGLADGVFLSEVERLEQIPVDERLHPEAVIEAITATGKQAFYEEECRRDLAPGWCLSCEKMLSW